MQTPVRSFLNADDVPAIGHQCQMEARLYGVPQIQPYSLVEMGVTTPAQLTLHADAPSGKECIPGPLEA